MLWNLAKIAHIILILVFASLFVTSPILGQINTWKMYVSNEGTSDVSVFDQDGTFLYSIPMPPGVNPRQVAVSPNGFLYVAAFNKGIVEYDRNDQFVREFGNHPTAHGLVIGPDARIYLGGSTGQIYAPDGTLLDTFPYEGVALGVSPNGNLLAVEGSISELTIADLDAIPIISFSTGLGTKPRGVSVDDSGLIYVGRDIPNDIAIFNDAGILQGLITDPALTDIYGVTLSPRGTLFVANFAGSKILEFATDGTLLSTINHDLSLPNHIAFRVDADGDGYGWPLDCNDADPAIFPGANEACDGIDNNCNGELEDGLNCSGNCDFSGLIVEDVLITNDPAQSNYPDSVWTGTEFGVTWEEQLVGIGQEIYFARVNRSGEVTGSLERVVPSPPSSRASSIAWTGSEYSLVYGKGPDLFFSRLDSSGSKIGPDIQLTNDSVTKYEPVHVWNGRDYGLAYIKESVGLFFQRLDPAGGLIGSPTFLSTTIEFSGAYPSLVWTGSSYGVSWVTEFAGSQKILFSVLDGNGLNLTGIKVVVDTPFLPFNHSLVWNGIEFGLAWWEFTDLFANDEHISFTRLDSLGERIGPYVLVSDLPNSRYPSLVWNGEKYGITWTADRIYFARLETDGTKLGADVDTRGARCQSSLNWTGRDFGVFSSGCRAIDIFFGSVGCDCPDVDLDGFGICHGDCDDSDSSSYPGAAEACDNRDNNCDSTVDEFQTQCGIGACKSVGICSAGIDDCIVGLPSQESCDLIDNDCNGVIDDRDDDGDGFDICLDCNDGDPSVFPGQIEICDGQDNDCDSVIDSFATSCGIGECVSIGICSNGIDSCTPGTPTPDLCDSLDNDCNGIADDQDADGDGFNVCPDCDDTNPAVNPAGTEICNLIDDNCNGVIDDGFDLDGDGATTCSGDCDDTNPTNFPGNAEICDNQDNNCNAVADEGLDADGDGFTACQLPVADCDDANPTVNPLQVEACTNSIDDNCNAFADCQETVACSPGPGREPGAVTGLTFESDSVTMAWDSIPRADVYDVLTGDLNDLRADGGFASGFCLAVRVPSETYTLTTPLAPGDAHYFLIRGKGDQCKLGTWGSALRDEAMLVCP